MSFTVAYNIAKDNRAFVDSEFLKKCTLDVVKIVCPANEDFENIRLSRRTMTHQIEHMQYDLLEQLMEQFD